MTNFTAATNSQTMKSPPAVAISPLPPLYGDPADKAKEGVFSPVFERFGTILRQTSGSGSASSLEKQDNNARIKPGTHQYSRRTKWILSIITAVILLGVVPSVALALTIGRRNSLPSSSSSPGLDGGPDSNGPGSNNNNNPNFQNPSGISYPDPEPMTGTIPNNANYTTLDPTLIRRASDNKLFLMTTGGYSGYVWTADSLRGPWTKSDAHMMSGGVQAGAPDVHQYNETTYIMFHNSHRYDYATEAGITDPAAGLLWHDASIFAATSNTLEPGSWTTVGRLDITWEKKYNILDPSLLMIPEGREFAPSKSSSSSGKRAPTNNNNNDKPSQNLLSFGSYYTGLFQVPLNGEFPVELAESAMDDLIKLEQNKTNPIDTTEASYMYYRSFDKSDTNSNGNGNVNTDNNDPANGSGAWYYHFFSAGRCCPTASSKDGKGGSYVVSGGATTTASQTLTWFAPHEAYRVMVCRSRDPRGEYFDRDGRSCLTDNGGTLILPSHGTVFAPGGQGVYDDPVEGPVLYYHYVPYDPVAGKVDASDKGYKFGWNKLDFSDDGWPKVVANQ